MKKRLQVVLDNLGLYGLWVIFAIFAGLAAFQLHATLIYLGILVVENPTLRPVGWTTGTIYALSRILVLVIGGLWLGIIIFAESYLRDGQNEGKFKTRVLWLFGVISVLYLISYLVLVLFS